MRKVVGLIAVVLGVLLVVLDGESLMETLGWKWK